MLDSDKTPDHIGSTYAGVVSRDSVRISFMCAALNGLDECVSDIRNAYLQPPSPQNHEIICGSEFDLENVGKKELIRRELYFGKATVSNLRNHLRVCMQHLDFASCLED